LAFLLRTPVYLLKEMPYDEYLKWSIYFSKRPIGWREDDRTMKLLQAQGVKAKATDIFPSLDILINSGREKSVDGMLNMRSFKKSTLFSKLLTAKGGDTLAIED
jgi:hypothetical protein